MGSGGYYSSRRNVKYFLTGAGVFRQVALIIGIVAGSVGIAANVLLTSAPSDQFGKSSIVTRLAVIIVWAAVAVSTGFLLRTVLDADYNANRDFVIYDFWSHIVFGGVLSVVSLYMLVDVLSGKELCAPNIGVSHEECRIRVLIFIFAVSTLVFGVFSGVIAFTVRPCRKVLSNSSREIPY